MRIELRNALIRLAGMESVVANRKDFYEIGLDVMKKSNGRSYHYIPSDVYSFVDTLDAVKKDLVKRGLSPRQVQFWDFGAGIGTKVAMASLMGFAARGIEFERRYINLAYGITGGEYVKMGDLTNMNQVWEDWLPSTPIVAYYYCPINDEKLERKFERELEDMLPKGSYLVPFLKKDYQIEKDSRFKAYSKGGSRTFYRKIKNHENSQTEVPDNVPGSIHSAGSVHLGNDSRIQPTIQ